MSLRPRLKRLFLVVVKLDRATIHEQDDCRPEILAKPQHFFVMVFFFACLLSVVLCCCFCIVCVCASCGCCHHDVSKSNKTSSLFCSPFLVSLSHHPWIHLFTFFALCLTFLHLIKSHLKVLNEVSCV